MKLQGLMAFVLSISFVTSAHAGFISDRASDLASRLKRVENQLDRRDAEEIRRSLDYADFLLSRYDRGGSDSSRDFVCMSDGEIPAFEKFRITNIRTNTALGPYTTRTMCEKSLARRVNNMICLSDGEIPAFEKFIAYDFNTGANVGAYTSFETCDQLIHRASESLMCVSNGEIPAFEKFILFNRNTRTTLGAYTSLNNCLSTIR